MSKIGLIFVTVLLIIPVIPSAFEIENNVSHNLNFDTETCYQNQSYQILFIGSSYFNFNNLPALFNNLVQSAGIDLYIDHIGNNGLYLDDHASSKKTEEKINEKNWDYVILQGEGINMAYPSYFTDHPIYPALITLKDKIQSHCSKTKIVYCMPWAFEDGMTWYLDWTDTFKDMQVKIFNKTIEYSSEIGYQIAPVGWTWYRVLNDLEYPLHYLHTSDWNHPSLKGSYLMACVLFSTLFHRSSVGLSFHSTLSNNESEYFQRIASETVMNNIELWNLQTKNDIFVDSMNTVGPWIGTKEHPFKFIQEGIDIANNDDVIIVEAGIYYENIIINKPISLIGKEKNTTIIDGAMKDDVITIYANDTYISGFTIQNSSYRLDKGEWWKAGIRILGSSVVIQDNIIQNNLLGIFTKQVVNLTIQNNLFFNDGITCYPYDFNSRTPLMIENYIHTIKNNKINGKPLIYLKNEKDYEISDNVGQVILVNCTNISVINISITHTDFPLLFVSCTHCAIEQSNFSYNDGVCTLLNSKNIKINNNLYQENLHGLLLDYYSSFNIIEYNTFSKNKFCGVICEYYSNQNIVINNNFFDNSKQNAFLINAFSNHWEKNYWDDWIGIKYPFFHFIPKIIIGTIFESAQNIISLINIDRNPSSFSFTLNYCDL